MIKQACKVFKVSPDSLTGRTRTRNVVDCRRAVVYLYHAFYSGTLKDIGRHLGGRHYSTVINLRETAGHLIDSDPEFANKIVRLKMSIIKEFENVGQL